MSPLREEALSVFSVSLEETKEPTIPFYSTVDKKWLEGRFSADYMWRNIEQPVCFEQAVGAIVERFVFIISVADKKVNA